MLVMSDMIPRYSIPHLKFLVLSNVQVLIVILKQVYNTSILICQTHLIDKIVHTIPTF